MKIKSFLLLLILITTISGCKSPKKIIYFSQDEIELDKVDNDYKLVFQKDDLVQITVTSRDVKSAIPFNLPIIGVDGSTEAAIGQPKFQNYLVDSTGNIIFPIIGKIKIEGLTREEVISKLFNMLSPSYIKDPIINIRLVNFRVTVLGDVKAPGTFIIPNERITILEAIGLAGDLNISGERVIQVIREEGNEKKIYEVDLLSKKSYTSPVYYLKQNDIIYVKPNFYKSQTAAFNPNTGLFISLGSVIIALLTLFR